MFQSPYVFPCAFKTSRQIISQATQLRKYVLVTGATGFIGAHIVDQLLNRGIKVHCATRSLAKCDAMIQAWPQFASSLDFVEIYGFRNLGGLDEAVKDIDAGVHVASVSDPLAQSAGRVTPLKMKR